MGRYLRATLWGGAIVASGWAIMTYTTPSEQKFYDSLSPDLKKKVDDARAGRTKNEAFEKFKASAMDEKPIWQQSDKKV